MQPSYVDQTSTIFRVFSEGDGNWAPLKEPKPLGIKTFIFKTFYFYVKEIYPNLDRGMILSL